MVDKKIFSSMTLELIQKLPRPEEVKERFPLSPEAARVRQDRVRQIEEILEGKDDRFLLVIGPCSADREDAVLDYIERLKGVQERVEDKILFVPRIYTNKPRTKGTGYKGMAESPDPAKGPDLYGGIAAIRRLHLRALTEFGFATADEMLYPENHAYLDDILGYVAIGARSVEDQQHRLTASGLGVPVGMKNPTSGDLSVMLNSIYAAQQPQAFEYQGWACQSAGNPYAHAVLRGYVSKQGESMPNYHYEDIVHLLRDYVGMKLENPAIIVDTNHSNSDKQYLDQPRIVQEVLHNMKYSPAISQVVKGFMIESYLVDGRQEIGGGCYGQSITDPCLGWEKTEKLIYQIADAF